MALSYSYSDPSDGTEEEWASAAPYLTLLPEAAGQRRDGGPRRDSPGGTPVGGEVTPQTETAASTVGGSSTPAPETAGAFGATS